MATKRQILAMKKALIKLYIENKDDYQKLNSYVLSDEDREDIIDSLPQLNWEQTSELLNNLEHRVVYSIEIENLFYGTYGVETTIEDSFPEYCNETVDDKDSEELDENIIDFNRIDDGEYVQDDPDLEDENDSIENEGNIEQDEEKEFEPQSIDEIDPEKWNQMIRDYVVTEIMDNKNIYATDAMFEREVDIQCRSITDNIKKNPQAVPSFVDIYSWYQIENQIHTEEEREKIENMAPVNEEGPLDRYKDYTDEQCRDFIVAYAWMLKRVKPGVKIEESEIEKKNPKIKLRNLYDDIHFELDRKYEKGDDVSEIGRLVEDEPGMLTEYKNFLQKAKDELLIKGTEYDFFDFSKVDKALEKKDEMEEFLENEGINVYKAELTVDELSDEYIKLARNEISKRSDEEIIAWYERFLLGDLVDLEGNQVEVVNENQEPEIQDEQQVENPEEEKQEDEKELLDDLSELSDGDLDNEDLEGFLNEKLAENKQAGKTVEENKSAEIEKNLIEAYSRFLSEAIDAEKTIAEENNSPDSYENLDLDLRLLEDLDEFRGYAENYTDLIDALDINVPDWINEYDVSDMDKRILGWYITNAKFVRKDENKEKEPEIPEEENIPAEQPLDQEEIEYETNKILEEFKRLNQKPEEKKEDEKELPDDLSELSDDDLNNEDLEEFLNEKAAEKEQQGDNENQEEKTEPDLEVIEEVPEEYDEEKPELEVIEEVPEEYLDDEELKQEEEQKQLAEKERRQKEEEDRKYDEESRRMEEEYQKGRNKTPANEVPLSSFIGEDEEEPKVEEKIIPEAVEVVKKEPEIKQEEKQPDVIINSEQDNPEEDEPEQNDPEEEEPEYEFDEDEYERERLEEEFEEQERREREQQIPVNNNPQPVENIVNEENNIQNQPEIPQVPENNNVLDENNLQPAENEHPRRNINIKSYSKALNELKKDLNSTLSIFSRDSDEFKDMMNYMNSFGNFEEYDEATRHDIIETLSTKVTAYMDHTKAKPIDNWRRNTRIDVFKKIGEVVGKYREGIQNPKEEYYAMATQTLIGVAHKAMPNKDHNELTRRLIASPTYKKLFAGMSMYQLDKVAYDEKAAADVLKQIAAGDKKLNAQKVQRHEEEELYIPEKVNNKTL